MSKIIDFQIQKRLSNPNDRELVTAFARAVGERLNDEYGEADASLTVIEAHSVVSYVLEEFLGVEHVRTKGYYCCTTIGQEGAKHEGE